MRLNEVEIFKILVKNFWQPEKFFFSILILRSKSIFHHTSLHLSTSMSSSPVKFLDFDGHENRASIFRPTHTVGSFYHLFCITQTWKYTHWKEHRSVNQKHGIRLLNRQYCIHPRSKFIFCVFWPLLNLAIFSFTTRERDIAILLIVFLNHRLDD